MRKVLFIILAVFVFVNAQAQEKTTKVSKSEAKELMNSLTADEKAKLLSQLLIDDEKLVNKTLKKALKNANKNHIDAFMKRKDMVFTPVDRGSKAETIKDKADKAKEVEKAKMKVEEQRIITPEKTQVIEVTGHEGHDHGHGEEVILEQKANTPAASYVIKDKNAPAPTSIKFEDESFDFGTIKDGESVTHTYKFTNTGSTPYVIANAKGSCGCTVPKWSKEPIAPGATSEIVVTFNSRGKGKVGGQNQSKRVTLTGNTDPSNTYLTIKGIVTKDK